MITAEMNPKQEFIKQVLDLARGSLNRQEIFDAFLEMAYCALAKPAAMSAGRAAALEARYMAQVRRVGAERARRMPELLGLVQIGIYRQCDVLGTAAAELGFLNAWAGQFFTPYEVCRLLAAIQLNDADDIIARRGVVTVDEPAAGSGAMLLAVADELQQRGHDPSQVLAARATDLSWHAYRMCFIQLACRGVPALVRHGDSLRMEVMESAWTPTALRMAWRDSVPLNTTTAEPALADAEP